MVTTLTTAPALGPLLARGALRSPFKRPRPGVAFSGDRLVLPGLQADLGLLAAYERVCGFPTGEDSLPVTYPHVLGFPLAMSIMSGRDFPLPLLGLVHTSIDITRHRALAATGTYALTVHVDRLAPHRRGTEAFVVTELRGEDAEVVWESTSTYLARHRTDSAPAAGGSTAPAANGSTPWGTTADGPLGSAPGEHPGSTPTDPWRSTPADHQGSTPTEPWGSRPGEPLGTTAGGPLPVLDEWRLAADVGRRYGAASGDRNPIHLHPLTARLFGFPRAIAHGMWTVARCLAAHGTPQAVRVRAEFRAPVLLPGEVLFAADGRRFELRETGEAGRVHLSGQVLPLLT